MKRIIAFILVLVTIVSFAGCSGKIEESGKDMAEPQLEEETDVEIQNVEKTKKVYFINAIRALDYFVNIEASVKKECEDRGYEVTCVDCNADYNKASEYVSQAILEKYDAIMICGDGSLIPAALEAKEAGIPVVNYDAYIGGGDVAARVSSDNIKMGKMAGEYAIELLKEKYDGEVKGNVVYINFSISSMQERCEGFKAAFENYPDVILEEQIPKDQFVDACSVLMENVLTANPAGTIDVIYGSNSGAALGALAAAETANRKEVQVIGIDDEEGQINALKESDVPYYMTVSQDPIAIGRISIEAIEKIFAGEEVGNVTVDARIVTKDNVEEFIANEQKSKNEIAPYK